jgi:hypothetical protein
MPNQCPPELGTISSDNQPFERDGGAYLWIAEESKIEISSWIGLAIFFSSFTAPSKVKIPPTIVLLKVTDSQPMGQQ